MTKKNPKKSLNKYARFSGVAFQMAATIFIGAYIGIKLDEKYPNESNIFTIVFTLLFIFAALYLVIKQVTNISD